MKLTSMRLFKRKAKKNTVPEAVSEAKYPWSLELRLDGDAIRKLGIDFGNTEAGDTVHFVCRAKVTSKEDRTTVGQGIGSKSQRRQMGLQITDMKWGKPKGV